MAVLRIQHAVSEFDSWKRMFDIDPIGRKAGGVRHYQVLRSATDPNFVMIDLTFDVPTAEAFLGKLRGVWAGPGKAVMRDPQAWIVEPVESADL